VKTLNQQKRSNGQQNEYRNNGDTARLEDEPQNTGLLDVRIDDGFHSTRIAVTFNDSDIIQNLVQFAGM
jgi:hypothetical protein